jgi:hypothetical protein
VRQKEIGMIVSGLLHRKAKSLLGHFAALLVLGSVVAIAAAQPKPTLEYDFDPAKNSLSKAGGIVDLSSGKHNGTELSGGKESAFVTGHTKPDGTTGFAIYFLGDPDTDTGGTGIDTGTDTATVGIDGGPFTVMAWVNRANFKQDNMVFGTNLNGAGDLHLGFRLSFSYCGFWGNDSTGPGVPGINEWHHFAVRYNDADMSQDIFIDGAVVNHETGHGPYGSGAGLIIGHTYGNTGAFSGAIEHPRVYGGSALKDEQILADAQDKPLPP